MSRTTLGSPIRMIAPLPNWRSIWERAELNACFLLPSIPDLLMPGEKSSDRRGLSHSRPEPT